MKAWLRVPEEVWEAHPNIDQVLRYDWPCRHTHEHGGMGHVLMVESDCREIVVRNVASTTEALMGNGINLEDITVDIVGITTNPRMAVHQPSPAIDTVFEITSHSIRSIVGGVFDRDNYVTTVYNTLTYLENYRDRDSSIRECALRYPMCYRDFPTEPTFHYTPVGGKLPGEIVGIPAVWCTSVPIMSHIIYLVRMWCSAYETHSGGLVDAPVTGVTMQTTYQDQRTYNGATSIFISMLRDFGPATYLARYGAGWWAFLYAMLIDVHNQVELPFLDNGGVDGFMTWMDDYIGELIQPLNHLLKLSHPPITLGHVD